MRPSHAFYRRHRYLVLGVLGLFLLWPRACGATSGTATAGDPLVLVAAGGAELYVVRPGSSTVRLVDRDDGTVMAIQRLAAAPTALALDTTRGVLYVAMGSGAGIEALSGRSLRPLLTLRVPATIGALSPVPGHDALYLADTATGRILYLSYNRWGGVRLTASAAAMGRPAPGVHVTLDGAPGKPAGGTFWAGGFTPGETVSLSLGASNAGLLRADPSGAVSGVLPAGATVGQGSRGIGLYGLSSGVSVVGLVQPAPARRARTRREGGGSPPLYLAIIPGPVVTVTPPLAHSAARVPLAAAGLLAVPLLPTALVARRRRRARKRAAAARATPRARQPAPARRVRVT